MVKEVWHWMRDILQDSAVFVHLPEWVQEEQRSGVKDDDHKSGKRVGVKRFTSHTGRRSDATILAESGVGAVELQKFGGWKGPSKIHFRDFSMFFGKI